MKLTNSYPKLSKTVLQHEISQNSVKLSSNRCLFLKLFRNWVGNIFESSGVQI